MLYCFAELLLNPCVGKMLPETYKMPTFHYIPIASRLVPPQVAQLKNCHLGLRSSDKILQSLPAVLEGI